MALTARNVVVPIPPAELLAFIEVYHTQLILQTVLGTLVIYDAACNLDREVKHFWKSHFDTTKVAFFLNRFAGIFGTATFIIGYTPNPTLNQLSAWGPALSFCAIISAIDYVLMIRVLALFHHEKKLTALLMILFVLEVIGKTSLSAIMVHDEGLGIALLPTGTTNCTVSAEVKAYLIYISWIIPLAFGALLLALALFKATVFWRENGFRGSGLLFVLIKDQALYYSLVIFCSLFDIVNIKFTSARILSVVLEALGSPILLCVLGNRIFFNLKEAVEHGINVGTNWSSYTHSAIRFDESETQSELMMSTIVGTNSVVADV